MKVSVHVLFYLLQRPTIDQCTTLPITGYFIHAIVTSRNEDVNERIYTSKYIDDMLGGIMGEFSVSYNASFEQDLEPNANYIFAVNTQNNVIEISRPDTKSSCSKYLYLCKNLMTQLVKLSTLSLIRKMYLFSYRAT